MRRSLAIFFALLLASLPALSQAPEDRWKIEFDSEKGVTLLDRYKGQEKVFIKIRFSVIPPAGKVAQTDRDSYKIQILEDNVLVKEIPIPAPRTSEDMSIVLAVDASGSMSEVNMKEVRHASDVFLKNLPDQADCGLLLFNHTILPEIKPGKDRKPLLQRIQAQKPSGGNVCFDAAARGINMLKDLPHKKAVVLVTNGLDLNSKATADRVIALANEYDVKVYTVGIGEKSTLEPVYSVLVLDHSGSMKEPANKGDEVEKIEKIQGLHRAGAQFLKMMPPTARTTLIPFSDTVDEGAPEPFSNDRERLTQRINALKAEGETALFDAIFAAVETLEAQNPDGKKRRIVAMTDGIDNKSRRRVDEVIARAKSADIPLYLIGLGREKEIAGEVMDDMAKQTGGAYKHAENERDLVDFFEDFSFKIHEDGIDEEKLQRIAKETGGAYFPARNAADLKFILESVTKDIKSTDYEEIFPSRHPTPDGLRRNVSVKLVNNALGDVRGLGNVSADEVLKWAASAEQRSDLPIARLIQAEAKARNLSLEPIEDFEDHPGAGIIARTLKGRLVIGSRRFLEKTGIVLSSEALTLIDQFEALGQTPLLVARDGVVLGAIGSRDRVISKSEAQGQTHGVVIAEMNHLFFLSMLGILGALIALPAWLGKKPS